MSEREMRMEKKRKLEIAMRFLQECKEKFANSPEMYTALLTVAKRLSKAGRARTREQMTALLYDDPRLLDMVKSFVPFEEEEEGLLEKEEEREGKFADEPICIDIEEEEKEDDDNHNEVEITGSKGGINALEHFPHARHSCVVYPFFAEETSEKKRRAIAIAACPKCYCYLCDRPYTQCFAWSVHCFAQDDFGWRQVRSALKAHLSRQAYPVQILLAQTTRKRPHPKQSVIFVDDASSPPPSPSKMQKVSYIDLVNDDDDNGPQLQEDAHNVEDQEQVPG